MPARTESFHVVLPIIEISAGISVDKSNNVNNERISSYFGVVNRAIECLNGGVARGGCVCRYKGLRAGGLGELGEFNWWQQS